jgi:hypothetical protein
MVTVIIRGGRSLPHLDFSTFNTQVPVKLTTWAVEAPATINRRANR